MSQTENCQDAESIYLQPQSVTSLRLLGDQLTFVTYFNCGNVRSECHVRKTEVPVHLHPQDPGLSLSQQLHCTCTLCCFPGSRAGPRHRAPLQCSKRFVRLAEQMDLNLGHWTTSSPIYPPPLTFSDSMFMWTLGQSGLLASYGPIQQPSHCLQEAFEKCLRDASIMVGLYLLWVYWLRKLWARKTSCCESSCKYLQVCELRKDCSL